MIIEQLRNFLILAVLFIVGFFMNDTFFTNPICPDDFKDSEVQTINFRKWIDNFYELKPEATISEMYQARTYFFIENNCKEAMKRYVDYSFGNIDEETKQNIEMIENKLRNENLLHEDYGLIQIY